MRGGENDTCSPPPASDNASYVNQTDDFSRSVRRQQGAPTRVMQRLRLLLYCGISARLGTDGKRSPRTRALDLGLAHPTSLTLKRDRPFIALHDSSCCVTLLIDALALRHVRGPPILITLAMDSLPRDPAEVTVHVPRPFPSLLSCCGRWLYSASSIPTEQLRIQLHFPSQLCTTGGRSTCMISVRCKLRIE
jgi:hypothetical protein